MTDDGNSCRWYILFYFISEAKLSPLPNQFPLHLGSFTLRFVETKSLEKEKGN